MQPKDVSTVRLSNLEPGVQKDDVHQFFGRHKLLTSQNISLCPSAPFKGAPLVGTVTFDSPADAKTALGLSGELLGNSSIWIERDFMGFTVLAAPSEPSLDIIAVHGLNGHAFGTWAFQHDGRGTKEIMWLRDFLPEQMTSARIIIYGYNSALIGQNTSVSSVKDFAADLLQRILDDRHAITETARPLIFICHSLGGIIVKQAIVTAHKDPQRYAAIEAQTKSILFLATPHRGSKAASIGVSFSNVAALAFQRPSKQLLQTLQLDSVILSQLSDEFRAFHASFAIVNFYERRKTTILNSLVVDQESSSLGLKEELLIPMDATHSQICKFRGPSDPLFLPVLAQIKGYTESESKRTTVGDATLNSQTSPDIESSPIVRHHGLFLVPTTQNPYFQGRKAELEKLDHLLMTQNRDIFAPCNPIVAVHGLGGIGKTQLATQYVYNRKARRPDTSIFWVSARSEETLRSGLKDIEDRLGLERDFGRNTAGGDLSLLKDWMISSDSGNWLLVIDNYDEIQQIRYDNFLPSGAVGSVLITTRDRKLIGPVANSGLALNGMDEIDAERLFMQVASPDTILDSPEPRGNQALSLILRELEYFPLAIDQAASFIRENSPMTYVEYLRYLEPRSLDREMLLRFKQARPDYPESVMTTWEISLQHLNRTNPRASWILQLLGFLDHNDIKEDLLTRATDGIPWAFDLDFDMRHLPERPRGALAYLKNDVGFRVAIGALISLSLVQRNAYLRSLSVHPLVHEWIRVRLNANPSEQSRGTAAACLILFQTFPSEVLHGPHISRALPVLNERVQNVKSHVAKVLINLKDYCTKTDELPLEAYILCETLQLAGLPSYSLPGLDPLDKQNSQRLHLIPKKDLFDVDKADSLSKTLDMTIQQLIPVLSEQTRPVATFIHRLVIWSQKQKARHGSNKTKHQMADVLDALNFRVHLDDSVMLLLMILATAIVDVTRCIDDKQILDFPKESHESSVDTDGIRVSATERWTNDIKCPSQRLFEGLHKVFCNIVLSSPKSPIFAWTHFMVKRHLLRVCSPDDFSMIDGFQVSQMLSTEVLAYLSTSQKGEYFCQLAERLWNVSGPRDFDGIKQLYSVAILQWNTLYLSQKWTMRKRSNKHLTELQLSSVKPSSFRNLSISPPKWDPEADLITPLEYLWRLTPRVAVAISDPKKWFKIIDGRHPSIGLLSLDQRRWAFELLFSMWRLYEKVKGLGDYERYIDVKLLLFFVTDETNSVLVETYTNTHEWDKAQRLLLSWLQCGSIIAFFADKSKRPWCKDTSTVAASTARAKLKVDKDSSKPEWSKPENCAFIYVKAVNDAIAAFIKLAIHQSRLTPEEVQEVETKLEIVRQLPEPGPEDAAPIGRLELIYELSRKFRNEINEINDIAKRNNFYRKNGKTYDGSPDNNDTTPDISSDELVESVNDALRIDGRASDEELDFDW